MFNMGKKKEYAQIRLNDFSDDDSDDDRNRNYNNNYNDESSVDDNDNDAGEYIRNQQIMMQQQDAGLDLLSQSVIRLGEMSTNISEELGQQNKMLESMETDLDEAGDELDIVTRSTKELIARSGGMSTFCLIAILSIVVLILLFLVIYT
uniref:t-SNARE coiled-coil homology domain-containing protein n=1 Tax=Pseudo-nitzschia australis TaxID=44445 RepID=A0A7S4A8R5_9STRA|mmetsp:Transcript_186/g.461  ORF Transcript_186/g.461 Transcript_186/m.461 type:complete len:149 (+) Transcript_186:498-944(+)|eukprot:CAMPEP_0168180090 /NCGR_PEP_ID=MMETSP0139_2-20121125/10278_1 /TAXON_ID=44445 /ORGANISM="Pseudo-nitzschia australis, Strain 10249 10 AB" /LENGTH=148 /DNA_ID=CAMNT_0008100137 /DNA_START=419 /DNA_END=865 /DNA_ORIENTATION=-